VASQQLTMFVSDYEKRSDARDMAAYRALGAMTAAIVFCQIGDAKAALRVLTEARDRYEQRDRELQKIKIQKEN
jgi:hypothetical protein